MSQNLHKLRIAFEITCESVDMRMLSSVWNENDYLFDVCGSPVGLS